MIKYVTFVYLYLIGKKKILKNDLKIIEWCKYLVKKKKRKKL